MKWQKYKKSAYVGIIFVHLPPIFKDLIYGHQIFRRDELYFGRSS